jgi:hypothetical protein
MSAAFVPCSRETWRAPWSMYEALRDDDPVHHVEVGDYRAWPRPTRW